MKKKLTSRKFLAGAAAFLTSFGIGLAGLIQGNDVLTIVGGICCIVAAAIYEALEATVDKAAATRLTILVEPETQLTNLRLDESVERAGVKFGGTDE